MCLNRGSKREIYDGMLKSRTEQRFALQGSERKREIYLTCTNKQCEPKYVKY